MPHSVSISREWGRDGCGEAVRNVIVWFGDNVPVFLSVYGGFNGLWKVSDLVVA